MALSFRICSSPLICRATLADGENGRNPHAIDAAFIRRAVDLADMSAGLTSPHPNFGCVITSSSGKVAGEGYLYAQGTKAAEALAVEAAGEFCRGSTAYLNMEPGDCHGDHTAVSALVQAGIERVVVGIRHPLQHLRGSAIRELRSQGIKVNVLGEDFESKVLEDARKLCLLVNAPLIHRACSRVPLSVLKYAMTLDGKIAASSGHAAWISSKLSRTRVFELRARSDAVIVGGNTVRRDDPRLTARHGKGHTPTRIVMTQSLDLPEKANLWDVSEVPTIVVTQRGARKSYQKFLASKGVEVVEFDMLNPREVMEYFHLRGYLSILWECGGTLAASAISASVIHKVVAFVAPKIIGGSKAPSPVGDLGMVEMTQALNLIDVCYEQVGPDMLVSGFLQPIPDLLPVIPSEDATFEIDPNPRLTARHGKGHTPTRIVMTQSLDLPEKANLWDVSEVPTIVVTQRGARKSYQKFLASKGVEVVEFDMLNPREVMEYFHLRGYLSILWECGGTLAASAISASVIHKVVAFVAPKIIGGSKAPSPVGDLGMVEMTQALNLIDVCYEQVGPDMLVSGFLQPIPDLLPVIPSEDATFEIDPSVNPFEFSIIFFYKTWDLYGSFSNFSPHPIRMPYDGENDAYMTWSTVEHYYQANKFVGVENPMAHDCVEKIRTAKSPEEAALIGRTTQTQKPELVQNDWEDVKIEVMYTALKCKFSTYPHLKSMLLSTVGSVLVEASPHDLFWGGGREGEGLNYLGRLLMQLRSEYIAESSVSAENTTLA